MVLTRLTFFKHLEVGNSIVISVRLQVNLIADVLGKDNDDV